MKIRRLAVTSTVFALGAVAGGVAASAGESTGSAPAPPPVVHTHLSETDVEHTAGRARGRFPDKHAMEAMPVPVVERDAGETWSPAVVERALGYAVAVRAGSSFGAGALVAPGFVLTARHVVDGALAVEVRLEGGGWRRARVGGEDAANDLAVLVFDGGAAERAAVAGPMPGVGSSIATIGSPRELDFTFHRGSISHRSRRFDGRDVVQTDLPANPGSSGGPVFDRRGRLVGVMSFVLRDSEGIAFVTPIEVARPLCVRAGIPLRVDDRPNR